MERCQSREMLCAHHSKMWSAVYVVEAKKLKESIHYLYKIGESTVLGVKSISK